MATSSVTAAQTAAQTAALAAAKELAETNFQTAQEAAKGDRQAQVRLARENAAKETQPVQAAVQPAPQDTAQLSQAGKDLAAQAKASK